MKRVSNMTIILTQCINFAAIFKQNVSKSKDNMTHCELQQLKSAQRRTMPLKCWKTWSIVALRHETRQATVLVS